MPAACIALTIDLNSWTWLAQLAGGGVRRVGGEEREGVVAPVVAQPLVEQRAVLDELVDRHQLDGRDAELLEVLGDRRVREAGVRAAQVVGEVGVELGQPLDVGLVDERLVVGDVEAPVTLPVEERVDHDAVRHVGAGVVVVAGVGVAEGVAEQGLVPVDLAAGGLGVGSSRSLLGLQRSPLSGSQGRGRGSRSAGPAGRSARSQCQRARRPRSPRPGSP